MRVIHLDDRDGVRPLPNIDSPDQAAASALGGTESRCEWEPGDLSGYDTALISMTKYQHRDREDSWMSAVPAAKAKGLRVWIFQEAEADWFNHRYDEEQLAFVANCRQADGMLCHTTDSAAFYRALLDIPTVAVPTLMPLSGLPKRRDQELSPKRAVILGTPDERARGWWALAAWKAAGLNWDLDVITRDGRDDGSRVKPVLAALGLKARTHGYLPLTQYANLINGASLFISAMRARAAGRDRILATWYSVPCVDTWDRDVDEFEKAFLRPAERAGSFWSGGMLNDWHPLSSPLMYQRLLTEGGLL